jgi:hypothetical protein
MIVQLDEHILAVVNSGANPAATLAEAKLLLEIRRRILTLEEVGRELLTIADRVNDVTISGRPAQSDELADRLCMLDAVIAGRSEQGREEAQHAAQDEPIEFASRRRERLLKRA